MHAARRAGSHAATSAAAVSTNVEMTKTRGSVAVSPEQELTPEAGQHHGGNGPNRHPRHGHHGDVALSDSLTFTSTPQSAVERVPAVRYTTGSRVARLALSERSESCGLP